MKNGMNMIDEMKYNTPSEILLTIDGPKKAAAYISVIIPAIIAGFDFSFLRSLLKKFMISPRDN
jgi:hypothetical protein